MCTIIRFNKQPTQEEWIDFTLAVTEMFWLLPAAARPNGIDQASSLFRDSVFSLWAERQGLVLSPQLSPIIRRGNWPDDREDFFARLVLILLHNLCPSYACIERDELASGWELPLIWLSHHLKRPELIAPGYVDEKVLGNSSIRMYLMQYRDRIDGVNTCYHWSVIAWMDKFLAFRKIT